MPWEEELLSRSTTSLLCLLMCMWRDAVLIKKKSGSVTASPPGMCIMATNQVQSLTMLQNELFIPLPSHQGRQNIPNGHLSEDKALQAMLAVLPAKRDGSGS